MFPEYDPQINVNQVTETTGSGKSFLFDFAAGEFPLIDGKLQTVTGIEALKIWVEKIIKTQKFKFKIYDTGQSDEYGTTLLEFINNDYPQVFIQAEIQREITEVLSKNQDIQSVESFAFSRDKRVLNVSFNINTTYGTTSQEVIF